MSFRSTAAGFVLGFAVAAAYFHQFFHQPLVASAPPASGGNRTATKGKEPCTTVVAANIPASTVCGTNLPAWESMLEQSAKGDLERLEKAVPVTPEQRDRLRTFFLEQNRIANLTLSPEEYDRRTQELGTLEDIIGKEAEEQMHRIEQAQIERMTKLQTERHIALISQVAKLTDAERDELRDRLNSDDVGIEESIAYARQELALTPAQESQYRLALHQYMLGDYPNGIESELDPYGGVDALGPKFSSTDENGERIVFHSEVANFLVRMKMKAHLSPEQIKKLEAIDNNE